MPKVNNIKGYYNDKTNYRYTLAIRDTYFTNKIVNKSFCYRDDYLHTKLEAECYVSKLANYLLEMRDKKEAPLKTYLDKIEFVDNSWN
tara:strand:- start:4297 stop:4560 length:264 start_codon:yes stop_codon:yes gene_type:complete